MNHPVLPDLRPSWIPAAGDDFVVTGRLASNWKLYAGTVMRCVRVDEYVRVDSSFNLGFHPDGWFFTPVVK